MSPSIGIFFSDSVLENWSRWFDREQKLWSPQGIVCATSTLVLPRAMPPLLDLNQLCPAAGSVEDCALSDLPDNVEFVTFSSGDYGEYYHLDRLNTVRLTLVEIEVQNAGLCVAEFLPALIFVSLSILIGKVVPKKPRLQLAL